MPWMRENRTFSLKKVLSVADCTTHICPWAWMGTLIEPLIPALPWYDSTVPCVAWESVNLNKINLIHHQPLLLKSFSLVGRSQGWLDTPKFTPLYALPKYL